MTSTAEGDQAPHNTGLADQPENTDESPLVSMAFKGQDRIVVTHWDGLLPSPENMAAYAKVSPDLPDKILRLAISEFQFQQELEKKKVKASRRAVISGVITVLVLLAFSVAMASALAKQGSDFGALLVVAAPTLSAVGAIVAAGLAMKQSRDAALDRRRRAQAVTDAKMRARASHSARMRARGSATAGPPSRLQERTTGRSSGRTGE